MGWQEVKSKVLELVTAVPLGSYEAADADRLTSALEGDDGEKLPTRACWLTATSGSLDGPLAHSGRGQRVTMTATLAIKYRKTRNRDRLDVVMADDWERVAIALTDPTRWATDTSGIITLWNRSEPAFPRDVVPYGDDTIQVITLSVQYRLNP